MAEAITFVAATRARVLEELARRAAPLRARIFLDGAVRELTAEVEMRTASGRVIEVRGGHTDGLRALMRVLLADAGRIEVHPDEAPPLAVDRYANFEAMFADAEAHALSLTALLRPSGGLSAIPVADLDQLVAQLAELPDAASAVLRLADGMRTVASILHDSPYDETLTARILQRLFASDVLHLAGSAPSAVSSAPYAGGEEAAVVPAHATVVDDSATGWDSSSALPTEDELEGEGVDADIHQWLENENVPEMLLSDDSFTRAFAVTGPPEPTVLPHPELVDSSLPSSASSPPHPSSSASPRPSSLPRPSSHAHVDRSGETDDLEAREAEIGEDDEDAEADSLVRPPPNRAVLAGALGALVVLVLFFGWIARRDSSEEDEKARLAAMARDTGPRHVDAGLVATSSVTKTATLAGGAADTAANLARIAPPIAGPDAPEDVKKAERLLNAGSYWEAGKLLAGLRETRATDPAVWVLSGQHYVDSGGRLQLAIEAADQAITIDPKFYRAWVLKGSVLQFLGRPAKAAEAYNKALAIDPNHAMSEELRQVVGQLQR